MIDSVLLQLETGQFERRKNNKFDGIKSQGGLGYTNKTIFCKKYIAQKKKNGIYCPMVNISKSKSGEGDDKKSLQIQVSLPKFIYGTNLYEIDEQDLGKIYRKIEIFLDEIGITTSIIDIKKAILRRVDFCKVIRLPEYLGTASEIIKSLFRFNYKPQSDFTYREFYTGGKGVLMKFWNSTQGYAIYDKISEILNNGYTDQEKKLIDWYKGNERKRNAIRFELSLQRKGSLDAVLRRRSAGDKKRDFYLEDVLNREIVRGILLDMFNKVFGQMTTGLITLSEMEDKKLRVYLENSGMSMLKQQRLYYWVLMTTINGVNGAWEHLRTKYSGNSITRVRKEIALALQELGNISGNTPNLIAFLRKEHENFEIIRPKRG